MNLLRGARNFVEDAERAWAGRKRVGTEAFQVGRNVAITPGKVVYRNRLIELIQYAPATDRGAAGAGADRAGLDHEVLHPRPEPAQLAGALPDGAGYTVFMISWKNPGPEDRDLSMEDYRTLGVMAALDAVTAIVPEREGACGRLLHRRHAARDRRRGDGARRRRSGCDR